MTTTNEVLATYVAAMAHGGSMENEFFDWLNLIRSQAFSRGVRERNEIPYWEGDPVNPYLEQA
mgnify:CR=1 FL=1